MDGAEQKQQVWARIGALLGYTLLTLLFTYPVIVHFGDRLAGQGNDLWIFQWNNWWVERAWVEGLDVYCTPYLFFPQGARLFFHSFNWFNTFLWLLLKPVVGVVVAHNLTVLLAYVVSGYTMYLLALEVTGSHPAAFLAGVVFAFFPYRHSHRNQMNLFSVQWVPLAVLYLVRLARTGRMRNGIWAGAALALCGLCSWHHLLLLALWGVLWLAYDILAGRWASFSHTLVGLVIALITCFLIVAPVLWPVVIDGLPDLQESTSGGSADEKHTDLLAYLLPSPYHPLIRRGVLKRIYQRFVRSSGAVATLGYTVLGLATWALVGRRKGSFFWGFATLFFAALSLGSVLQVNGHAFPSIPTPYSLLVPTLLGKILRHPARFNIIVGLSTAMLAALGAAGVLERLASHRRWGHILFCCLGLAVFLEYLVLPYPTALPVRSEFFHQLRLEPGQFAVADFPIGFHAHDKWYMHAQTIHGRPMVGGHVSRIPAHAHDLIGVTPLLEAARIAPPENGLLDDISRQLKPLSEANVQYVLIHKYRAQPSEVGGWRTWFSIKPHYEDEHLLVFNTAPHYGQDFEFAGELADGIGVVEARLSAEALAQDELLEVEVIWGSSRVPENEWTAYLALIGPSGQETQRVTFEPCLGWPTSEWGQDTVARGRGMLQVDPFVKGGTYTTVVGLLDPVTAIEANTPLVIGQVEIQAIERTFDAPEMEVESNVIFSTELRLLGYDLHQTDDQVTIILHWQALQHMDVAYKFFVHLVDPKNGDVVAQADVMPHNWTYPTSWWETGEFVSDRIALSTTEVPSGTYRLEIGIYDPDSGSRLLLTSHHELEQADRLVLSETVEVQ